MTKKDDYIEYDYTIVLENEIKDLMSKLEQEKYSDNYIDLFFNIETKKELLNTLKRCEKASSLNRDIPLPEEETKIIEGNFSNYNEQQNEEELFPLLLEVKAR